MDKGKASGTGGLQHPFPPVADARSSVLILGSFPSVKSRETEFYYGHPQNRFWKLLAILLEQDVAETTPEKIAFLHANRIALWDVVNRCEITGSADSTLLPQAYNDVPSLLRDTQIFAIFANGQTAGKLYEKHIAPQAGISALILPSTSPANAAWSLNRLAEAWRPLRDALFENRVKHE